MRTSGTSETPSSVVVSSQPLGSGGMQEVKELFTVDDRKRQENPKEIWFHLWRSVVYRSIKFVVKLLWIDDSSDPFKIFQDEIRDSDEGGILQPSVSIE